MRFYQVPSVDDLVIPIPENYKDCVALIKSDDFRARGRMTSLFRIWLHSFKDPRMAFSIWFRFSAYRDGLFYWICRIMLMRLSNKYCLQIAPSTLVGYGLYLGHNTGVIINATAIIGNNVNFSQFCTIGANDDKAAVIGNNVYIGPNTCVVEHVYIGHNATIGAGSVVTKNVPENATVAGVPAKIISNKTPARYINNPYISQDQQ